MATVNNKMLMTETRPKNTNEVIGMKRNKADKEAATTWHITRPQEAKVHVV